MQLGALIAFAAIWLFWMLAFLTRKRTSEKAVVTAPAARWGIALQGLGYAMAWFAPPEYWARQRPPWALVAGPAFALTGTIVAWYSVRHLGKQWRVQAALNADHDLIQSGPYKFVRHPIYGSMLAMFFSVTLLVTWPPLLVPAIIFFIAGT